MDMEYIGHILKESIEEVRNDKRLTASEKLDAITKAVSCYLGILTKERLTK